jgi:adenosylcobinamide kinase / adenosylcobinamide-phosphate guanylyltransferase
MQSIHRKPVTLVLGGVRSGKSHYAQQLGEALDRVVFVATAQAADDEMRRKVDVHRKSRPPGWQTVEAPLDLAGSIRSHGAAELVIVDCLTMFAANLLDAFANDADGGDSRIHGRIDSLCRALKPAPCPVVLVSNEVGSGVVPAYPSGRRFRDLLGELNQSVARVADNALLMVAGLPLVLKGQLPPEASQ